MYDTVEVVYVVNGVELTSLDDTFEVEIPTKKPTLL